MQSMSMTSHTTQLPSPVESTSSAGLPLATPISNLRRDQLRRSSDPSTGIGGQPRSMSMPLNFQGSHRSSNETRSQSTPHQSPLHSQHKDIGKMAAPQLSTPLDAFQWAPVKQDPSSSRASPVPHSTSTPNAEPVQENAESSNESRHFPSIPFNQAQSEHFSSTPAPPIPGPPSQVPSHPPFDSGPVAGPSKSPAGASNAPSSSGNSDEPMAMDLPTETVVKQPPVDVTLSAVFGEGGEPSGSTPFEGFTTETKPMISDDGVLLVENGVPPQDAEMADADNGEDPEEENEPYDDLTDDEGPSGTKKLGVLECCSEVYYDEPQDVRHCQMCE